MDESEETGSELIIAHSNPAELLELEEEGFHKMAFLVEPPIDEPWVGIIFPWRDTEIRVMVGDKLTELPLAVSSVREDSRSLEVNLGDQFFGNGDVSGISGSQ